jgi:hypothetical protein
MGEKEMGRESARRWLDVIYGRRASLDRNIQNKSSADTFGDSVEELPSFMRSMSLKA